MKINVRHRGGKEPLSREQARAACEEMASPGNIFWSAPARLDAYREARCEKGIYIVGYPSDPKKAVERGSGYDPYLLGNWPTNFTPCYVGISAARKEGVRGRLRAHQKRRGNQHIATRVFRGQPLYFIAAYGPGLVRYECLLLCSRQEAGWYADNIRSEHERYFKLYGKLLWTSKSPHEQDHILRLGDYNGTEL